MVKFLKASKEIALFGGLMALSAISQAAQIEITVLDDQGKPFSGAVVELLHPTFKTDAEKPVATMAQVNKQFKPHVLVVQQDSQVGFPNYDSIKHHVYSFSEAKSFRLRLYKDQTPEPLTFDKSGIVALGCNVHDWMVGYIYVAQSNQIGRSDKNGKVTFEVEATDPKLRVWHPRMQQTDMDRIETLNGNKTVVFNIKQPLHPEREEDFDEFSDYE